MAKRGGVNVHLMLPVPLVKAIRKDAAGHYTTVTQWVREAVLAQLKRRGALPKA